MDQLSHHGDQGKGAATRWSPVTKVAFWNYSGQCQMHEAEPSGATSHSNQGRHSSICCRRWQQLRATCSDHGWNLSVISGTVPSLAIFPENGRVVREMQGPRGLFYPVALQWLGETATSGLFRFLHNPRIQAYKEQDLPVPHIPDSLSIKGSNRAPWPGAETLLPLSPREHSRYFLGWL